MTPHSCMHMTSSKHDSVFELIRSMSKAEKRNFKLYATRLAGNQEAKFLSLFDCMDALDEYDEGKILQRCPIKKEQLPNMKAHLYKQILVSIRLLDVQRSLPMQLREMIDFAGILYDKGLYRQSSKQLEKAREQAETAEQFSALIEISDMQKRIESLTISRSIASWSGAVSRRTQKVCEQVSRINDLSNVSMQLYSLYLKLGYARTQKDIDLIEQVFAPQLRQYDSQTLSFTEKVHYYQAMAWYHYIRHDLLNCYRCACRWTALFDREPRMKELMYDFYLRGYSRLLEGLFLLRSYKRFVKRLEDFYQEIAGLDVLNDNARMIAGQIWYSNLINRHFYEGTFSEGVNLVPRIERFLATFGALDIRYRMLIYYKIACLYFGNGDYAKCMEYLARVIRTRDPQIRRDLQCYARILNLICSYESGMDYNIDYQIRSVYVFLVKMNDMQQVQQEMMAFLKRVNSLFEADFKEEFRKLYKKLKPFENHPYERRTFYYLDVLSWLQSKLDGVSVAEVIRRRFLKEVGEAE